jgi:hypothetical protein
MKTFAKIAAAFALLGILASAAVAAPPTTTTPPSKMTGKMMTHKKGGYVHATTVMTKSGKMVHRKGYYRHATKMTPKMGKMKATTPAPAAPKM